MHERGARLLSFHAARIDNESEIEIARLDTAYTAPLSRLPTPSARLNEVSPFDIRALHVDDRRELVRWRNYPARNIGTASRSQFALTQRRCDCARRNTTTANRIIVTMWIQQQTHEWVSGQYAAQYWELKCFVESSLEDVIDRWKAESLAVNQSINQSINPNWIESWKLIWATRVIRAFGNYYILWKNS